MRRLLFYLLTGIFLALLQSSVLPAFLAAAWRPALLLVLVLLIGVSESLWIATFSGLYIGAVHDCFSGTCVGLYASVYTLLVLLSWRLSEQLNVESPPLLLLLISVGTLLENLLVGVLLIVLGDSTSILHVLLPGIPGQLGSNLLFAIVFMPLLLRFIQFSTQQHSSARHLQGKWYGA